MHRRGTAGADAAVGSGIWSAPMRTAPPLVRGVIVGLTLSIVLVLVACSGNGGSAGGGEPGSSDATKDLTSVPAAEFEDLSGEGATTIVAKDNSYVPQFITVSPGTKITFDNKGRAAHNVIPVQKGAFEKIATEDLQPGDSDTIVLDEPGVYPYYCSLHGTPDKGMFGRIIVAES